MSRESADDAIVSGMSDVRDLPLDDEIIVDDVEYARIMRRLEIAEDEPGTTAFAFNSSI